MTWYMRIACWIINSPHTLRLCNTRCFTTATLVARTRLIVTYIVSIVVLNFTFNITIIEKVKDFK